MEAAGKLKRPMRAETYTTLIGLLATTGLRVGEAIRLDRRDVNAKLRVLVIRESKFGKSREVPLHETTAKALATYARRRDRFCPHYRTPSFFLSTVGTRLIYKNVHRTFHALVTQANLQQRRAPCRPRLHDLRHSFAVRTLLSWYRAGVNVEVRLPLLSTYLGHINPASTYWYLSAVPELLALVCQRLEQAQGKLT
jgi:integrase